MMLKKLRVWAAVLLGGILALYFLDFAGWLPGWIPNFARIQLVPALLAGSLGIVAVILLMTLLFGRIYCSVVCPLGIFQDVVAWLSKKTGRKKYYHFTPGKIGLRYVITAAVVVAFLLDVTVVLGFLEPYSAFGRIMLNVFRPMVMSVNNLLAWFLNSLGNYTFYHTEIFILDLTALLAGGLTLGIVGWLAWKYGRTWCNTMCPVGTILGILSRYSLWKVRVDKAACNSCGLCERNCKAACIQSKEKKIDYSRCVTCYNCLTVCRRKAIKYVPVWRRKQTEISTTATSRRQFVATLTALTLAAPAKLAAQGVAGAKGHISWQRKHPLCPPGAQSAEHLLKHCTACHLCVARCPSRVLKPAFMDYGVGGMMQPRMDFGHGFCNFDCTICTTVCPNAALLPLTKEEKHQLQVGRVVFVRENCIVNTDETSCGACSEHCPTQAVSMVPYKNGLTIPAVNPEICVGCGGCEYVCPVRPFRAIYVEGNPVHLKAKAFQEAEKKEIILDDFGF